MCRRFSKACLKCAGSAVDVTESWAKFVWLKLFDSLGDLHLILVGSAGLNWSETTFLILGSTTPTVLVGRDTDGVVALVDAVS